MVEQEFQEILGASDVFDLLLDKLSRRGVLLAQIPRFVKDVLNILGDNRSYTEDAVNDRLGRLGWGEHILDGYILELIRFLAESPGNQTAAHAVSVTKTRGHWTEDGPLH